MYCSIFEFAKSAANISNRPARKSLRFRLGNLCLVITQLCVTNKNNIDIIEANTTPYIEKKLVNITDRIK